jgi:hypothetical protein
VVEGCVWSQFLLEETWASERRTQRKIEEAAGHAPGREPRGPSQTPGGTDAQSPPGRASRGTNGMYVWD